jgi:hypothetical protein
MNAMVEILAISGYAIKYAGQVSKQWQTQSEP